MIKIKTVIRKILKMAYNDKEENPKVLVKVGDDYIDASDIYYTGENVIILLKTNE